MNRVLVLMSRLSDYMLNCMEVWRETAGIEIHIVRHEVDSSAPFHFDVKQPGIHLYRRDDLSGVNLHALARKIDPELIICFGWMDSDYLSVARARRSSCRAVMTMDNQWLGTLRQSVGIVWSRLRISPFFDHIWVPGPRQQRLARMLGFKEHQIHAGLYVANDANFNPIWQNLDGRPPAKRLIFIGRYAPEKGLDMLWHAFIDYHARTKSDLELWCAGTGPLDSGKPAHPRIHHLGFVQPADFAERLSGGGVFVLPSRFEPWGLVVQEFALAGCPMILSRYVGAADSFLGADNGVLLPALTSDALTAAIAQFDAMSDGEREAMAHASRRYAKKLTTQDWALKAQDFVEGRA